MCMHATFISRILLLIFLVDSWAIIIINNWDCVKLFLYSNTYNILIVSLMVYQSISQEDSEILLSQSYTCVKYRSYLIDEMFIY
jgi:hypothetical protein